MEVMFAVAIGTFILAAVLTSYIFSVKGFSSLSNYAQIQSDDRQALDWFGMDMQAGIGVSSFTSNRLVAILPKTVNNTGNITATNLITHVYQSGMWYRINGAGATNVLARNVSQVTFYLYDTSGNVVTQASQAVRAQVDLVLTNKVDSRSQSTDCMSARYRMRNTP